VAGVPRDPWFPRDDRLRECFHRIEAAAGTHYSEGHGGWSEGRPYHFTEERVFLDAVEVAVNFGHEGDDHLRYSVRIQEHTIARRSLATGPTGLIDVRDGLEAAIGDVDAAFDKIIEFLDANVKLILRADPTRPPGLSDFIAEFRRFITS
jgi:hypothetical protein